ncbi:MAG: SDR family NAD(P)-dependent oxidoreductase [Planctomycetes bacterium]|nr:SDR family NAD(P)-dependent oxidoreductase [Planctomycetota bacterium]
MARRTIKDARAIVTGASSGIGREIALELSRQGAKLVILARREEKLQRLADEIRGGGGAAEIVVGDVTDPAVRSEAIEAARRAYGGLDILINNAGIGALGKFADADPERLRRIMEVNFFSTAEMIRAALPSLREGNRPIVVNVSSVLGHRGVPLSSEYCASKFAVQGLSESLRAEFSREGIDLLVVSPSTTDSEFFQSVIEQTEKIDRSARRMTPAATVAQKTVRAIARGKHEIVISFLGWLLTWGNRQSPRLLDYLVAKHGQ